MSAALLAFIARYLGVSGSGTNPVNRGQCVGLVELWILTQGQVPLGGNAKDLLVSAAARKWRVTYNAPQNYPGAGDVAVWNSTWGNGYGHTAIALVATSMHLVVFEQNDPTGAAPLVSTQLYTGVAGWFTLPQKG